jgi:hypothetical protein
MALAAYCAHAQTEFTHDFGELVRLGYTDLLYSTLAADEQGQLRAKLGLARTLKRVKNKP